MQLATPAVINFYGANKENGFLSNFYPAPIFVTGNRYPTTEHYYQAQKSAWQDERERIRLAPTPHEAAKLGRRGIKKLRPDWDTVKYGVMLVALMAKFTQHPNLAALLLATGDEVLVENTINSVRPDPVWGNGNAGEGMNWLGKLLMLVRDEINHRRKSAS